MDTNGTAKNNQTLVMVLGVVGLCLICASVAWYVGRTQASNVSVPSASGATPSSTGGQNSEAAAMASTSAAVQVTPAQKLPALNPPKPSGK